MNTLSRFIKQFLRERSNLSVEKPMKGLTSGALALISALIAAASLISAPPASAGVSWATVPDQQNTEDMSTNQPAEQGSASKQGEQAEPSLRQEEGLILAEQVYNSADPDQARNSLSVEDQEKLDAVTRPATLDLDSKIVSGAENFKAFRGCWEVQGRGRRKALFGNTLYTYWQTTRVCAANGRVTSVKVTEKDGETSTPGWRIAHAPTSRTKNVRWEGRGVARYYFVFGAGGWDLQHPTDCLQLRLNADGYHYRSLTHCSLDVR